MPERPEDLTTADLLEMYRTMVLSRTLDERVWLLNRQGKAAIAASAQGHEASQIATVKALDPSRDHFLIYYRQFTVMLGLGTTPSELLSGFLAREGEPMSGARQFPLHGAHPRVDLFSFSNVVATQLPQAVGVALADKMRGSDAVTVVFFGDGAASQGDTHEAMNFAGIHRLPVIFLCENNRYAISVPLSKQMPVDSVASRASGYGFPGVVIDGTDMIAVYEAVSAAAARARAGDGPTLVEVNVERLLPHTTDDDHTRYRPPDDIEAMKRRDPIDITRRMLISRGLLTDEQDAGLREEARKTVNTVTDEVEALGYPSVETMYDHLFAESPGAGDRA
ncbi:MAG: thiamine pyrophosphate-dependent dehydrogenase E1 component subunit alpha [Chloroflexi bacterium]|nr:thiamine pyrophosphate-dependent dehydrogenase E1 component subunit alpha [Chloroflexota bacterium]MDA1296601.1 thiamine pyrophosphate-dependent dehydrogenase E1 component subunit alpha [Chloroflexota bacterium]